MDLSVSQVPEPRSVTTKQSTAIKKKSWVGMREGGEAAEEPSRPTAEEPSRTAAEEPSRTAAEEPSHQSAPH